MKLLLSSSNGVYPHPSQLPICVLGILTVLTFRTKSKYPEPFRYLD